MHQPRYVGAIPSAVGASGRVCRTLLGDGRGPATQHGSDCRRRATGYHEVPERALGPRRRARRAPREGPLEETKEKRRRKCSSYNISMNMNVKDGVVSLFD